MADKNTLETLLDGHNEPDGTDASSIENQRGVPAGEDWLTWKPNAPITKRVIDVGGTKLTLDEGLSSMPLDQLKTVLATTVPELKTGTVTEKAKNGVSTISVKPKAGRKG